jgi:hypothetical protein
VCVNVSYWANADVAPLDAGLQECTLVACSLHPLPRPLLRAGSNPSRGGGNARLWWQANVVRCTNVHMLRRLPLLLTAIFAWALSVAPAWAQPKGELQSGVAPTVSEIESFVRREWRYFSNRIRTDDALALEPKRMISVPHILCSRGYDRLFFKCATLIVYEMPNGRSRSSLVRHEVERDVEGRLQTAIVTAG